MTTNKLSTQLNENYNKLKELKNQLIARWNLKPVMPEVWFETCLKCGSKISMYHREDVDDVIETGHLDACETVKYDHICHRCHCEIIVKPALVGEEMEDCEFGHSENCKALDIRE